MHGGFQRAYDAVHVRVLTLVEELTSTGDGPWEVYVTGHSLGGALATLCAYELATRRCCAGDDLLDCVCCDGYFTSCWQVEAHQPGACGDVQLWVTKGMEAFGLILIQHTSQVGNLAFAKAYNAYVRVLQYPSHTTHRAVPESWRITNSKDVVATVPRLMGYCHTGNCLQLGSEGGLVVQAKDAYGRQHMC